MNHIENLDTAIENSRLLREKFLSDPYRPAYHFVTPEDYGIPGDPNGAFFARGRYHLMYLYACRSDKFRWGHLSSTDLLHWRSHPDILVPDESDGGIFSGGAFVDDDGTCYITYWGLPVEGKNNGGVRIAKSSDPFYEKWEKFDDYVLSCTESGVHETKDENGEPLYLGCADPSNIWKKDGKYYLQTGNLSVLIKFKVTDIINFSEEEKNSITVPENIKGDWVDLFESEDLINWKYLHRFYERKENNEWTLETEDDMCPSFLPLPLSKDGGNPSDKYLQLFISHNKGCQYYIGSYDKTNDMFYPETHGRMTWVDNTFFAPEALIDDKGRQIMWSWFHDNIFDEYERGWSGVYSLPRTLWLKDDNTLGIAPAPELEKLRYNTKIFGNINPDGNKILLDGINGVSCEIKITADFKNGEEAGLYVRASEDFSEYTKIYYNKKSGKLVFDSTLSGKPGRPALESAPLILGDNEKLELTVFIDHAVIEVFANERQAISRQVYPAKEESINIYLFSQGDVKITDAIVHEISPTNFC